MHRGIYSADRENRFPESQLEGGKKKRRTSGSLSGSGHISGSKWVSSRRCRKKDPPAQKTPVSSILFRGNVESII